MKNYTLSTFFVFYFSFYCFSQISIAPTTVFADRNGIASLYITNPSSSPQEVSIEFLFGYPGNDEYGNLLMIYGDSLKEVKSGLGSKIRTFPRNFILGPNQQQTVRIQVVPDKSRPDGTYFSRVKIISAEQTADVETTATEGVSTRVNFKFEQVIAAFYKVGEVTTGLEFSKIEAQRKDNTIAVDSEFTVTGNSPFLGSLQAEVKDASGKVVATHQQTVALYYEGKRAYSIPLPEGIAPGTYQVNLLFKTERSDIPTSDLVQAPPVSKTLSITL